MEYATIMQNAAKTYNERGEQYGDLEGTHYRIAQIASLILGRPITPYDVAMILHAVKLGRLQEDRKNPDNYIDGINYFAFAGSFITATQVEDDIAAIAKRFAPIKRTDSNETDNSNNNGGSLNGIKPDTPSNG
jgi:hypothetical protein